MLLLHMRIQDYFLDPFSSSSSPTRMVASQRRAASKPSSSFQPPHLLHPQRSATLGCLSGTLNTRPLTSLFSFPISLAMTWFFLFRLPAKDRHDAFGKSDPAVPVLGLTKSLTDLLVMLQPAARFALIPAPSCAMHPNRQYPSVTLSTPVIQIARLQLWDTRQAVGSRKRLSCND